MADEEGIVEIPVWIYRTERGLEIPVTEQRDLDYWQERINKTTANLKDEEAILPEFDPKSREPKDIRDKRYSLMFRKRELNEAVDAHHTSSIRRPKMLETAVEHVFGIQPYSYSQRIKGRHTVREWDEEHNIHIVDEELFLDQMLSSQVKWRGLRNGAGEIIDRKELKPEQVRRFSTPLAQRLWTEMQRVSEPTESEVEFR